MHSDTNEEGSTYDDGYDDGHDEGYDDGYSEGFEIGRDDNGLTERVSEQDIKSLQESCDWKLLPRCPVDNALVLQEGNELKCQLCRRVYNLISTTKE